MEESTIPGFDQATNYKNQLLENFNKSIGISEAPLSDPSQYNPQPKGLDITKNITGNPVTGSNPGAKTFDFSQQGKYVDSVSNYLSNKAVQDFKSDYQLMKPYSYNGDYDGAKFERYYNTDQFKQLGFSPYQDNEHLYNDRMSFGDQFVRAASQWPSLFATGFKSSATAWGEMFTDPLAPDLKGAKGMMRAMELGSSTKGGVGGFFINQFLNSAYTVGVGADMLVETLALKGAGKLATGFGKISGLAEATKFADETIGATKNLDDLSQLRTFWNTNRVGKAMAATGRVLNPLEGTWQVGKELVRGENTIGHLSDYARWVDNFSQFAKDAIQIKAAVSEAKLEGGMSQMNITKDLVDEYRKQNGKDPDAAKLAEIESIAKSKSAQVAFWNLPAIMWSNKFMYETMFKPFEKGGAKLVKDIVFNAEKKEFEILGKSLAERAKQTGKSLLKPRTYLEYGRDYLKVNLAEGLQENIQEAISMGAASHAKSIFTSPERAAYETYMGHFMNGVKQQFSAQGLETFAGGFLMGAMAGPIMTVGPKTVEAIGNRTWNKEAHLKREAAKEERTSEVVNTLNELYKTPLQYFAPEISNVVKQTKLNQDLFSAQEEYNKKKAKDIQDLSVFEHIYTAYQTGHIDTVLDRFKNYKQFTPEEAAEAFYGVKNDPELGKRALNQIDNIIDRAESIKEDLDLVSSSYPNKFDPNMYTAGTPEHEAASISYTAWEEAKKNLVFAKNTFKEHNNRIQQIEQAFINKSKPIANASAQDLMVLLDPDALQTEARLLSQEIKVLDASTPEGKKEKKRKEKKLELLNNIATNVFAEADVETLINMGLNEKVAEAFSGFLQKRTAKQSLIDYMKHIGNTTKSFVFDDDLEQALKLVEDSLLLKNERYNLVRSINVLSNPTGFLNLQYRLAQTLKNLRDEQSKIIKDNIDSTLKKIETNEALQNLYKRHGITLTEDYALRFYEAIKNNEVPPYPTEFIDTKDNNKVINSGEKFEKALEDWKASLTAISKAAAEQMETKPEETKKEEKVPEEKEEIKPPVSKTTLLSADTPFNSLPEELQKALQQRFLNWVIEQPDAEGMDTNDPELKNRFIKLKWDDLLEIPAIASIVNKYQPVPVKAVDLEPVVSSVKPNDKQQKAIAAIEKVIAKSITRTDDEKTYTGGRKRATQVVEELLQSVYGIPPFKKFMNKVDRETDLVKQTYNTHTGSLDELITKLKSTDLGRLLSNKQFDIIKDTLEKDNTYKTFANVVNELAWASSATRGNTVDDIIRDYFSGVKVSKPDGITIEAFNSLISELQDIQKALEKAGMLVYTAVRRPDGKRTGVITSNEDIAGEIDILAINKDGNFEIYDIKTAKTGKWKDFHISDESSKKRYTLQQSIYKKLLEDETGIPVSRIALFPIETENDKDGVVTQVRRRSMGKLIYASPGAGKTEFIKQANEQRANQPASVQDDYQEFIDADGLLIEEIKRRGAANQLGDFNYNQSSTDEPAYLYEFAKWSKEQPTDNLGKSPRKQVYEAVGTKIDELLKEGKSVLTGSIDYVKKADLVYMAPKGSSLSRKGFDEVQEGQTTSSRDQVLDAAKDKKILPLEKPISNYLSIFKRRLLPLTYDKAVEQVIKPAVSDLEAKKADIERRRQESIKEYLANRKNANNKFSFDENTKDELNISNKSIDVVKYLQTLNSIDQLDYDTLKSFVGAIYRINNTYFTISLDKFGGIITDGAKSGKRILITSNNERASIFVSPNNKVTVAGNETENEADYFIKAQSPASIGEQKFGEQNSTTGKPLDDNILKINAEYDAELADLETEVEENISDDIYNVFKTTKNVPIEVLKFIANKRIGNIPLSPREKEINTEKLTEINDIIKDLTSPPSIGKAAVLKSYNDMITKIRDNDDVRSLLTDVREQLTRLQMKLDYNSSITIETLLNNRVKELLNNPNDKTLKYFQEKELEVVYSNPEKSDISGNYIVVKADKNSATLASPATLVVIPAEDFQYIKLLGQQDQPTFSDEDVDTAKKNFESMKSSQNEINPNPDTSGTSIDDLGKALTDITNNIKCN